MRFFRLFFAVLTIIFILVCYFMWVTEVSNWKVGDELYLDAGSSELFNNYTEDSESSAWGGHVDRHVESYLQLGQSTALVEPALKDDNAATDHLLIAVLSAPDHVDRRYNIRRLSGRHCKNHPRCDIFFVLGTSDSDQVDASILKEAREFGDLLVENFGDAYSNLTLKTLHVLNHFVMRQSLSHLLKVDDDVFFNVPATIRLAHKLGGDGPSDTLAAKTKRWVIPMSMYSKDRFPPYMDGRAYFMTKAAAECLLQASLSEPLLHLEDVYVTGILASSPDCHIKRVSAPEAFQVTDRQDLDRFDPRSTVMVDKADRYWERLWKVVDRLVRAERKRKEGVLVQRPSS